MIAAKYMEAVQGDPWFHSWANRNHDEDCFIERGAACIMCLRMGRGLKQRILADEADEDDMRPVVLFWRQR